ncbi:MAG TPA: metallophosphoesterase family protein [Candidatus Dormibacteraeota bacterium]|nr:metallophosphoesterase family protein [Candidatus Dormibacteraeota bacterium]
MTRIGVLADTHCPEFLDRLPERVFEVLSGADLILHAGDINGESTLAELARIAPVEAVRGDHDRDLGSLPAHRELRVDGRRIVLVHGNRSRWLEEPATLLWTVSLGHYWPHRGLSASLRRRFPDADVIVYGHTHRALIDKAGGPIVFNPGGVHQWTPVTAAARLRRHTGWFEWCWLQVARHIRSYPPPTIGILEVTPAAIEASIVAL